jgi:YVTN family beta-propeller protein
MTFIPTSGGIPKAAVPSSGPVTISTSAGPPAAIDHVFVTNYGSSSVSVIDAASLTVIKTVDVGASPFGIAATPTGKLIFLTHLLGTHDGYLSSIDAASYAVTSGNGAVTHPKFLAVAASTIITTANTGYGGVAFWDASTLSLISSDGNLTNTAGQVVVIGTLAYCPFGSSSRRVKIFTIAARKYVGAITSANVGTTDTGLARNASGTRLYVPLARGTEVAVLDVSSRTTLATVAAGATPRALVCTPDDAYLYVVNAGHSTVSVVDLSTSDVAATIDVGTSPTGIAISPSGDHVWVCNSGSGTVSCIDTATNTVTGTVTVGTSPRVACVVPPATVPTYLKGDLYYSTPTTQLYVCTVGGKPGTWEKA